MRSLPRPLPLLNLSSSPSQHVHFNCHPTATAHPYSTATSHSLVGFTPQAQLHFRLTPPLIHTVSFNFPIRSFSADSHSHSHSRHSRSSISSRSAGYVDYYAILGVTRDTAETYFKSAYYELAKQYHPDALASLKHEQRKEAEKQFALISEAYKVLSDPSKRQHYDTFIDLTNIGDQHRMLHWMKIHRPPQQLQTNKQTATAETTETTNSKIQRDK